MLWLALKLVAVALPYVVLWLTASLDYDKEARDKRTILFRKYFLHLKVFLAVSLVFSAVSTYRDHTSAEEMQRETLGVVTGGDSFCYVDFLAWPPALWSGPKEILATLMQEGRFDVHDVSVSIIDDDAFDAAIAAGQMGDRGRYERRFPPLSLVGRHGLLNPLATFSRSDYRRFTATVRFREGETVTFARFADLGPAGARTALIVTASYFDGRKGVVHTKVDTGFPVQRLESEKAWQEITKLAPLAIQH